MQIIVFLNKCCSLFAYKVHAHDSEYVLPIPVPEEDGLLHVAAEAFDHGFTVVEDRQRQLRLFAFDVQIKEQFSVLQGKDRLREQSLFFEHIQRVMGSPDQILSFADRKMVLHPFPEGLIVHGVNKIAHIIRSAVRSD